MSTEEYVRLGRLRVAADIDRLIVEKVLPGTGVAPAEFWRGLQEAIESMAPRNKALLDRRDELQALIDDWLRENPDVCNDVAAQHSFLEEIAYLVGTPGACTVSTDNVDREIATVAGPQLVVPVDNARYALNAANARWGSLYDALYGTDAIDELDGKERGSAYNPVRGAAVVARSMQFLDAAVPLQQGSHATVSAYRITGNGHASLQAVIEDGDVAGLERPEQFRGFVPGDDEPEGILLVNNGLHIEIAIDRSHPVGAVHPAGIRDVILEAAITTIEDCEDSVAAVDAEDKCRVYDNWLGLNKGTLTASFDKNGEQVLRSLQCDRRYISLDGGNLSLPGRSLMLVRNVGIHMYTDAVLDAKGDPIPEGILDAFVTAAAAIHGLDRGSEYCNSRSGSIYIVKPKMHGPDEVAFTSELFAMVENVLGLERNTIKLGIMDEERRTTVNLKSCIAAAPQRVIFINTGFLDRTGDEIHTLMEAGPFVPKPEIKNAHWMLAYEDWNVDTGIACGLPGNAQIGKGMWAMPDAMADMLEQKGGHPLAGASTAWVPSPTAAILHAMHYHAVSVARRQAEIAAEGPRVSLRDLLMPALLGDRQLSEDEVERELRNNVQGILGYVVRWIDQGVGCSRVPDINDVGLMEDRATLRISSQHIGNWLRHGLVAKDAVQRCFERMAATVDEQNETDPNYTPMSGNLEDSCAFQAALELVFAATVQPNGYTEFILTKWRREAKKRRADSPAV